MNSSHTMKKLRTALHLAIILETTSKILCLGIEVGLQRQDHKRSALFYQVKEDEVLKGHVISIHEVFSELDCMHKCLSHDKCISLNFQLQSSHLRHACELNDVTRALSGHALEFRNGFSYWEPILLQQEVFDLESVLQQEQSISLSTLSEVTTALVTSTLALATSSPSAMTSLQPSTSSNNLVTPSPVQQAAPTALLVTSTPALATSSPPVMTSLQLSMSSNNIASSSPVQQAEIDCGADWHSYNTGCVRLFINGKTRQDAKNHCNSFLTSGGVQGSLVKIMSQEDNSKIVSLSSEQGTYFIGLNDLYSEGVYKWGGGVSLSYTNWAQSHPQSSPDCVVINLSYSGDTNNGKWMSENCGHNNRFICECPGACS